MTFVIATMRPTNAWNYHCKTRAPVGHRARATSIAAIYSETKPCMYLGFHLMNIKRYIVNVAEGKQQ